jgi:hypothetical protein
MCKAECQTDLLQVPVRRSKYTAEFLRPLVESSRSLSEVIRKLGLKTTGGNHRYISSRIQLAELDISHFHGGMRGKVDALTAETLEPIVAKSRSVAAVCIAVGLPPDGRPHRELARRLRELELDMTHFRGPGWSRGFTAVTHPSVGKVVRANRIPDDKVFISNGAAISGPSIVRRLLELGVEYRCATCAIAEWCGRPLVLHLDHINGIHNDHRRTNIRLLCPNCHSQTDTYCNKAREPSAPYVCSPPRWALADDSESRIFA